MQYYQSTHHPPGTAHSMPYQQSAPYGLDEEYSHGMGPPQAMYALPGSGYPQGMASMGYSGSALPTEGGVYPPPLPGGMLPPPQDFAPLPQTVPHPPAFPPQEAHPAPPGNDNNDDNDNDEATPETGEKAAGKRPAWGAATSVHDGSVTALAYSADGKYVASGSEDMTIIIWDAPGNAARHRIPLGGEIGHSDTVTALAFSRDNIYLASASNDEELIIWAVANGRVHKRIALENAIHSLAYTPDGKYLIAGASNGVLLLWDADTHDLAKTLDRNTAAVTFIIFSRDGSLMATGGTESVCHIWEIAKIAEGKPLSVLEGHRGMVCAAAFSNDNRRIITASDDGSSRIWNARSGEALVMLHEHTGPVWTVAFSPDGKRVASGSSDSTVKICDSYSGDRLLSLEGHDSMINAVEFSPDGNYIASAASDNTVRLWNAHNGENQTTYNEHNDNVTTVMFSRDGSTLASGSHDGTVRIRPLMIPRLSE